MTTPTITPVFSSTHSIEGAQLHHHLGKHSQWPLTAKQSREFGQFLSNIGIHLQKSQQDYDYEVLEQIYPYITAFPDAVILSESAYKISRAFAHCEHLPSPQIDKMELLIKHLHHQSLEFFITENDGTMRPFNITPGSAQRIYIPDHGWTKNDEATLLAILTKTHTEDKVPVAQSETKQKPPYLTLVKS